MQQDEEQDVNTTTTYKGMDQEDKEATEPLLLQSIEGADAANSNTPNNNNSSQKAKKKTGNKLAMSSVVKVFVVKTKVSYKMPWQKKAPKNSTGSGFTISGRRILTNAHVVEDATSIMVRRHGNPKRFVAKVLCVGHQCDIALLQVDDDAFWKGCVSLEFGTVPNLQQSVTCVGYPTGGDNISVTCGVVSRVDVHMFVNRYTSLLAVQIDAAINAGNSGGPVFMDNKVAGIAFSSRTGAQNIGYIIPVPVVMRFLNEFEKCAQCIIIEEGIMVAKMESPALRKYYGMPDDKTGVLVTKLNPLSSLANSNGQTILQEEDILLEIDGVVIADDGTVPFRDEERVCMEHLIGMKYSGDKCQLKVWRGRCVHAVETVLAGTPSLVPKIHNFDCYASYFIVGGLVFCPLTVPFLSSWYGRNWQSKTPSSLLWYFSHGMPSKDRPSEGPEQIVVLSQILASTVTVGYRAGGWCVRLKRFNGVAIRNLKHLVQLVEDSCSLIEDTTTLLQQAGVDHLDRADVSTVGNSKQQEGSAEPRRKRRRSDFLRFDVGERGTSLVLDTEEVCNAEQSILQTHSISSPKSADLCSP